MINVAVCISGQYRESGCPISNLLSPFLQDGVNVYVIVDVWNKAGKTTALDRIIPNGYLKYFEPNKKKNDDFDLPSFKLTYPKLFEQLFESRDITVDFLRERFSTDSVSIECAPGDLMKTGSYMKVTYPSILKKRNPRSINSILMFYKIWHSFNIAKEKEKEQTIQTGRNS